MLLGSTSTSPPTRFGKRAANAWESGYFDNSVIPIRDHLGLTLLERDEHLRPGTTTEDLAGLNPAFAIPGEQAGFDDVVLDQVVKRFAGKDVLCFTSGE